MFHTFRDRQRRTPLIPQDVKADAAVGVDVRVVDAGGEVDLGRLERIIRREVDCQEKDTTRVGRLSLWTADQHSLQAVPHSITAGNAVQT